EPPRHGPNGVLGWAASGRSAYCADSTPVPPAGIGDFALATLSRVTARAISTADAPPATADLVIVGGGIVGCATAFFAARAGIRSVVIERRAALGTLTTPASTGAFRLQFDNPEEIELVREAVELFDAFAESTGLDGWDLDV